MPQHFDTNTQPTPGALLPGSANWTIYRNRQKFDPDTAPKVAAALKILL